MRDVTRELQRAAQRPGPFDSGLIAVDPENNEKQLVRSILPTIPLLFGRRCFRLLFGELDRHRLLFT